MLSETEREAIVGSLENERQARFSGRGFRLESGSWLVASELVEESGIAGQDDGEKLAGVEVGC